MDAAQQGQSLALVDRHDRRRDKVQAEVDVPAGRVERCRVPRLGLYIFDLVEAFRLKQFLGYILRRDANARDLASLIFETSGGGSVVAAAMDF